MDEEDAMNQLAGPSTGPAAVTNGAGSSDQPMSKNAMKRAAKQARMDAEKPEKRKAEKLRRKENAQKLSEGFKAGTLSAEELATYNMRRAAKAVKNKVKKREDRGNVKEWQGGVVIDLDFDELMTEQEVKSMASQIGYVYSANRLAETPVRTVLHTSFSERAAPRIHDKVSKTQMLKWSRCYWQQQGIDSLAKRFGESSSSTTTITTESEWAAEEVQLPPTISPETHQLVYLSADSDNELETLSESEIYIIGGIVDRNRYKNLCQEKAERLGIKTARLPIGTYLQNLPTRKVLTVNQVFSILVEYIHRQSWAEAFDAVIPQRKFEVGRKRRKGPNGEHVNVGAGSQDEEDEADDAGGVSPGEEEADADAPAPSDWSRADGGQQDREQQPANA